VAEDCPSWLIGSGWVNKSADLLFTLGWVCPDRVKYSDIIKDKPKSVSGNDGNRYSLQQLLQQPKVNAKRSQILQEDSEVIMAIVASLNAGLLSR